MDRLGAMRQFVQVVEAGSFSAAARILGQGQPAISKAIAQLETRLGVTLITRTTRALTLTDAGRAFYERTKTVLDAAEEADAAARGAQAALSGRLRICAPVTFARLHIIPALPHFMADHPALDLELVLDDRRIDLIEEGIDLAVRAGPLVDSSMIATRLATGRRRVIGAPSLWSRTPPMRTPTDLTTADFVAYGPAPGGIEWVFARGNATSLVRTKPRLRINALEGVREAVFAGLGFAIVSEWSANDAVADGRAVAVFDDYDLPAVDLWTVFPANRQPSARVRAFSNWLSRTVNRRNS